MRYVSSGRFEVSLAAAEAIALFTPEGERDWVPEWSPRYATGVPSEARGTVFTTAAHGPETIWVIIGIDRSNGSAAYARVTPGHHGGLVTVACNDSEPGKSLVTVSYDMELLGDHDSSGFDAYQPERFPEMMSQWSQMIAIHLESQAGR